MTTKIEQKIVGCKVVAKEEATVETFVKNEVTEIAKALELPVEELTKNFVSTKTLKRPLRLDNDWRLKPPYADHALYVRLNAIEVEGRKHPYEIFFNTKDVTQIEWINALTLTLSIAFRTAIEAETSLQPLINNLKETFGTKGSYLSKVPAKPKFVNGIVAEIGYVIEEFNNMCLAWNAPSDKQIVWETKEELSKHEYYEPTPEELEDDIRMQLGASPRVEINVTNPCPECREQLELLDGCLTCVRGCGYSKCG